MQQVFMCLQCSRVLGRSYSQLRVLTRSMSRHPVQEPESVVTQGMRRHLEQLVERHATIVARLSSENSSLKQNEQSQLYREVSKLEPIVKLTHLLEEKRQELLEYNEILREEEELAALAMEDRERCVGDIRQLEVSLINALVPQDEADDAISTILEVRSGAGGREASLFTSEMFTMYNKFADYKGWKFEHLTCDISDDGGYKSASASITGTSVYKLLKLEAGVHRVQRVPSTEGLGRVHTSTMSVAVLPQPSEVDVHINPNDLKVETFRAQGAGGQHVNTTDSAVRMTHTPSGIVVKMQDERSQHQNRVKALKILRARLYEVKREERDRERVRERKEQIGSGGRQERIRTYNYNQDRVTDHRVGVTLHGVLEFLQGGHQLEHLLEQLKQHQLIEYLTRTFGK